MLSLSTSPSMVPAKATMRAAKSPSLGSSSAK